MSEKNSFRNYHLAIAPALIASVLSLPPLSSSAFAQESPASEVADPTIGDLAVLARFEIPDSSHAKDVRWASKDSTFLSFESDGVSERSLAEGLPIERVVIPRHSQGDGAQIVNMGISGSRIVAAGHKLYWGELNNAAPTDLHWHESSRGPYYDDVDVRNDTVAVLGYPSLREFEESERTFLWLGDLKSGLQQWLPLSSLRDDLAANDASPAIGSMGLRLGSVRFLDSGDLLVFPAFKAGVYRFSRAGKQKAHWSMKALRESLLLAMGRTDDVSTPQSKRLESRPPSRQRADEYIASQSMLVLDTLPIGAEGALLARYGLGDEGRYYLVILGAEPRWYRLPMSPRSPTERPRGDYLKSAQELLVLLAARGGVEEQPAALYRLSIP